MKNSALLNPQVVTLRGRVEDIVKELHHLTTAIGNEELALIVSDLRNRIHEPFMFVVVGEVKAGKSSFINALLQTQSEICKVSPAPCTDTIQQIMYGEKEEIQVINPFLKQLFYPIEILQEIAVVDTPGTNTIIDKHQAITEQFIPASDLIVFVFECKNPYRQSAWDFFKYIHKEWQKKILFVLQQKDLMPENDLAINIEGVKEYAHKQGILTPIVYAVSAKQEMAGELTESGFAEMRSYIQTHITGGKAPKLKLQNNVATGLNIAAKIHKGIETRQAQFRADTAFRDDIKQTLDQQELKSKYQMNIMLENLLAGYDKITAAKTRELEEGLSVFSLVKRSFVSLFSKESSSKEWLQSLSKDLENELNTDLRNRLTLGINDLADSIQQMAKMIDLKIKGSQTILKHNDEIFNDIAERRIGVLRDLQEAFGKFMTRTENFSGSEIFDSGKSITPNVVTGSGLAVIGVVLAAVTKVAILDITGGLLATVGLLFAGVTIGVNRGKVLKNFQAEIAAGRTRLQSELEEKLTFYIRSIKQKIDGNFVPFDAMIANEAEQLKVLSAQFEQIQTKLKTIEGELTV